jgi:tetratricopeptide (TPR) repeat protein
VAGHTYYWAGQLAWMQGDHEPARTALEASLALVREAADHNVWAGFSLALPGNRARQQGDLERARALMEEGLALWRAIPVAAGIAFALRLLGDVVLTAGDLGRAGILYEESLAWWRPLRDQLGSAHTPKGLGQVAMDQGDSERAGGLFNECLQLGQLARSPEMIAQVLTPLGLVALEQGESERADALLRQALVLHWERGAKLYRAPCLEGLAGAKGRWREAVRLLGSAASVREAHGVPLRPSERAAHDRTKAAGQAARDAPAYAATWAQGRALPLDDAAALALEGRT